MFCMKDRPMRIINVGSMNVDHVYRVDHFVRPGETLASTAYDVFPGGKGFNQSIALIRAGMATLHVGCICGQHRWLCDTLAREGVDVSGVQVIDTPTGHAMIQVAPSGENAIVIHAGANGQLTQAAIEKSLQQAGPQDWVLLQNETSGVAAAIRLARQRGLQVALNPAPMNQAVLDAPLDQVDLFILNETEAHALTGASTPTEVQAAMQRMFPAARTVLTLGSTGACWLEADTMLTQAAAKVKVVDTTAAGDTFIGYFLAQYLTHGEPAAALAVGCQAAAICVTRPGAAVSIPHRRELAGV